MSAQDDDPCIQLFSLMIFAWKRPIGLITVEFNISSLLYSRAAGWT
jgi:hypothetical protein